MAEHQLPKLIARVRFPSPAPTTKAQVAKVFRSLGLVRLGDLGEWRAINGPLARRDEDPGCSAVIVALVVLLRLSDSGYFTVSCPSTSYCEAAEWTGDDLTGPYTASFYNWNGTSWGAPLTYSTFFGYRLAISCPATTYCAAIDQYGLGMDSGDPALDWGDWNFDLNFGDIVSLSCASASQCLGSDFPGNQLTWDGTGWDGPYFVDDTILGPVTCVSSSFCATVSSVGDLSTWAPGTGWTSQGALPEAGDQLACATATFCAIYGAADVYFWNGSTWGSAYDVDPAKSLAALTCVSATWCMAVSTTGNAYRWNGSTWSAVGAVSGNTDYRVLLSCPTASFCMAGTGTGAMATWNGTAWRAAPALTNASISQISCVNSSYCVAALGGTSLASDPDLNGSVSTWNGVGWTAPLLVDPDNEITALSCPTTSFCAAGDFTGQLLEFTTTPGGSLRFLSPASRPAGLANPPRLFPSGEFPRSPSVRATGERSEPKGAGSTAYTNTASRLVNGSLEGHGMPVR
jgi:hypothetical protein